MAKKFYVTTAIDYVNAEPHIGHAYQKVIADVLARWHKLHGDSVFFVTGTDEHGRKVANSAEKAGKSPKEFAEEMSEKFKEAWSLLNVHFDRFIRTTDPDHSKVVQDIIKAVNENGDIYKGVYEGFYCVGCEAYYTEKDLVGGNCPIHKKKCELLKEESYFFKLSKYKDFLLDLYKKDYILPKEKKQEVVNRVKEGLKDLSISRTSFNWGIPFPLDKKHVVYVWFDALINYYTATRPRDKQKFWPADIHLLGKDNTWFHTVYWPAMLKSAGIEMPKATFNHGFITVNGEKISKSLGNVISPKYLVDKYGADTVRYFLCRHIPFGEDGDFAEKALVDRHNNELANKLGNLVSRVAALAEKYGLAVCENTLLADLKLDDIEEAMKEYRIDKALSLIFEFIDVCNGYVQDKKPWETHDKKVLYELVASIKAIAILLWPFMPATSDKIAQQFGFKIDLKTLDSPLKNLKVEKAEILFKKI